MTKESKDLFNFDGIFDVLLEEANTEYNTYLVVFDKWEDEDEIKIRIKQDVNRPNNPDDDEIIEDYIMNNYGYKLYTVIPIDDMDVIDL